MSNPFRSDSSAPELDRRSDTISLKTFSVPSEAERPVSDEEIPTRFGRFEVQRLLGKGAMGRVLEAFDPDLERSVALKVVPIDEQNRSMRERLLAEARIASKLEHPNIVPVYEMGAMDGWLYFAMRRIAGRPLSEVLRGRAKEERWARGWTRRRMLDAFLSLCRAVGYAHSQGVLHQDLKPSNVMLGEMGEVQLLDWGIARTVRAGAVVGPLVDEPTGYEDFADESTGSRERDRVWGTPGYMSPERIRGQESAFDPRGDIWALGVILYEILTLRRGFVGNTAMATLTKILRRPQKDPRRRTKDGPVPDDLAEIVQVATAGALEERYLTVSEMVASLEAHLDGSRRRLRAAQHLRAAKDLWEELQGVAGWRRDLQHLLKEEEQRVPEWAPLEAKTCLFELRRALADLEPKRASLFGRAVGSAERAVTEDPGNTEARRFLARAFWSRYLEAEAAHDRVDMTYFGERVDEWDDGALAEARKGEGSLSLRTVPEGARVTARRFDRDGPIFEPGPPQELGTTPLEQVPLAMGSYVLTIEHPEREPVTYPVFITRNEWWDSGRFPVHLPKEGEIADGFAYVPGGPYRCGGDPEAQDAEPAGIRNVPSFAVARLPVTMREYCAFINALAAEDPDAAWERVPRYESGVKVNAGQYWERPADGEPYVVPEVDRDGDPWDPDWPVMGVSWEDAMVYVAWRSERDGRRYALPTEPEWEKAARGVDGRIFPWGNGFDPSLCHMRASFEGRPQPTPVGTFPTDVSVYGMQDVAGGVRDWCAEVGYHDNGERRPVRGGSWDSHEQYCRIAHRTGYLSWYVASSFGFRLIQVLDVPDRSNEETS